MSEKAGPELDARLAEALGLGRDVRLSGSTERVRIYTKNPFYSDGSITHLESHRLGPKPYSTDIGAAVSAAEEMRKAGRIESWEHGVHEGKPYANLYDDGGDCIGTSYGDTLPHALTLALVAALSAEPVESMKGGVR